MRALNSFEFSVRKHLEKYNLLGQKFLIAYSTGLDSAALLHVFFKLQKAGLAEVRVAHIHHGKTSDEISNKYRKQAQDFAQKVAAYYELAFFTNPIEEMNFVSEEQMRDYRYKKLHEVLLEEETLVLAHHFEDLLETRLLRLIRGTGIEGLKAMHIYDFPYFRPFLETSKTTLSVYQEEENFSFLPDPSNEDDTYLRNWLRKTWLPQLEEKRAGSMTSLARSLETILSVSEKEEDLLRAYWTTEGISRGKMLGLDRAQQMQVIVQYLHSKNIFQFRRSQIEEIMKRLDNPRNELRFRVMSYEWIVGNERIEVEPSR